MCPWCVYPDICEYDAYTHDPWSAILDLDAYTYDARMYDAYICDPWSLTLMHVCMMHVSTILDPDSCVYDAFIYDPWSLTDPDVCMCDAA